MILNCNDMEDVDAYDFFSVSTKRHVGKVIRAKIMLGLCN